MIPNEIIIVYNPLFEEECKAFFYNFTIRFPYLDNTELKYPPKFVYPNYEYDLIMLNQITPTATTIDFRGISTEPVKMYLPDSFFGRSEENQLEIVLHELGHLFTNDKTLEILRYKTSHVHLVTPFKSVDKAIMQKHAYCLKHLLQIINLCNEVNAEVWMYQNESYYSHSHIQKYYNAISPSIAHLKDVPHDTNFFFEIPEATFFILFRFATLEKVKYDFTRKFLNDLQSFNAFLHQYAAESGWGTLRQITYQDAILDSVRKQDCSKLIYQYEEIFDEFIRDSMPFFPLDERLKILPTYHLQ